MYWTSWFCRVAGFFHIPQAIDRSHAYVVFEKINRLVSRVSALTSVEISTAKSTLGEDTIDYTNVRVAEGGLVGLILKIRGNPAITMFHTINFPSNGSCMRNDPENGLDTVIHELTHIIQFERLGSKYICESLIAQDTDGYDYGGKDGLARAMNEGKHFKDYNREQQASIAEDYFKLSAKTDPPEEETYLKAYRYFINELRNGDWFS